MKIFIFIAIIFVAFSSFASASIRLSSRNMPTHCEYVFEVDSEIQIRLENMPVPVIGMLVSYQNEYTKTWSNPTQLLVRRDAARQQLSVFNIELKTMSTNPKYLIRKLKFSPLSDLSPAPAQWYQAEFGREFGEKCFNSPRDTPFKERPVLALP